MKLVRTLGGRILSLFVSEVSLGACAPNAWDCCGRRLQRNCSGACRLASVVC